MPALKPSRENGAGELSFTWGVDEGFAAALEPSTTAELDEAELEEVGSVFELVRAKAAGDAAAKASNRNRVLRIGRSPE
jgi:hypothetical protein